MDRGGAYQRLSGVSAAQWVQETLEELGERVRGQPDPIRVPTRETKQGALDSLDKEWEEHVLPHLLYAGYTSNEEGDLRNLTYEAVLNAVEHGNAMEAGTIVRVQLHVREDGALLAVTDEGDGFTQDDLGTYLDWNEEQGFYRRGEGFGGNFPEAMGRDRDQGFTVYIPWRRS